MNPINKTQPLSGRKIAVTRSLHQSQELIELLHSAGAKPLALPTIRIDSPENTGPLDSAIVTLQSYNWLIFTSTNAVEFFISRLREKGHDTGALQGIRLGAVGSSTSQRLRDFHLHVDYQPETFTADALAEEFKSIEDLNGKRILLPRADIAPKTLITALQAQGAVTEEVTVYRTVSEEKHKDTYIQLLRKNGIDMITFTSSSTVKNFVRLLGESILTKYKHTFAGASIGPATSKTMRDCNIPPVIEAEEHTIRGLVESIIRFYTGNST